MFARQHPVAWLREWVARDGDDAALRAGQHVRFVVQAPSDVVVVPEHWSHLVINLASSIAVALEDHL